jgi:hypothetical protein
MGSGNYTLEYKLISSVSDKVEIQAYNKYFYDNIILMAPTVAAYGIDLKIKEILEFVDFHHNIMVFFNNEAKAISRKLANEFGAELEEGGYTLNGGMAPENSAQSAYNSQNVAWSKNLFTPLVDKVFTKLDRPVLFEDGVGMTLDSNTNN